jgi:hypothetical protein
MVQSKEKESVKIAPTSKKQTDKKKEQEEFDKEVCDY